MSYHGFRSGTRDMMTEPTFVKPTAPMSDVLYPKTENTKDSAGNNVKTEVTSKSTDADGNEVESDVMLTRIKDANVVRFEFEMCMLKMKEWMEESKNWAVCKAKLYALVLVHCPPTLRRSSRP